MNFKMACAYVLSKLSYISGFINSVTWAYFHYKAYSEMEKEMLEILEVVR